MTTEVRLLGRSGRVGGLEKSDDSAGAVVVVVLLVPPAPGRSHGLGGDGADMCLFRPVFFTVPSSRYVPFSKSYQIKLWVRRRKWQVEEQSDVMRDAKHKVEWRLDAGSEKES